MPEPSAMTPGQRVRALRKARGLTQAGLAAQSGLSVTAVKFIENGRRNLSIDSARKLAPALRVDDLADLYGADIGRLSLSGPVSHPGVPEVRRVLTTWHLSVDGEPQPVEYLRGAVDSAWRTWHTSARQRTEAGEFLPGLLDQLQRSARLHTGEARREALALLAQGYHMAQAYLAWHGDRELVWLTADRGMSTALEADEPVTIAGSVWYTAHLLRAVGRTDEASDRLREAIELMTPLVASSTGGQQVERAAMLADLHLCSALTRARAGDQSSWQDWGRADTIVRQLLPAGYAHPWTQIGPVRVEVYGVMCAVEMGDMASAANHAYALDPATITSTEHRARHLLEVARLADLEGSREGVLHLLSQAADVSTEVIRYSPVGRDMVRRLVEESPAYLRAQAVTLAGRVGVGAD
ncbi:helix-turn-helix domain-containing protein [Longispora albida]|uniref:helix-turn-helix domain-containing protein n=1 Tax=Longispora albida TaxID=203523 RepID=UPI000377E9A4|nr:helix-turn-helix transcriptional regulator [Longispora albida]